MMIRSDSEVFKSKSSKDIAEYLRNEKGLNVIPIKKGTKEPDLKSLAEWFDKKCDLPVSDLQSIAILHGKVSGTYALDLDHKDIIKEIFNNITLVLKSTLVIKTPKNGNHIIYKAKDGDFPPLNIKLFNKEGKEIDIKTQGGYTLLPPSQHNEVNGNYEFISETLEPFAVKGSAVLETLEQLGYYEESKLETMSYSEINSSYNNWPIDELITGAYMQGERRRKQNSYYIKLRKEGKPETEARAEVLRVNQNCKPEPLKIIEVNQNIKHAEVFYQRIKNLKKAQPTIKDKPPDPTIDEFADRIMEKHKFVTLIDTNEVLFYHEGVYRHYGEAVIREECERIIKGCDKNQVSEVIAKIQRRTQKDRLLFNTDFSKLVLDNGILCLDCFKLLPFDPDYLTTVKLPVTYNPTATCPMFISFLKECLATPSDIITTIELISNILTANKKTLEISSILIGDGANGKSTLLKIIRGLIGYTNCSAVSIHSLQWNRFAVAQTYGKLVNIYADISNKELENLGVFKQLVSGEAIDAEKKNKDAFNMIPFAKHFFSANEMPNIKDNTDGAFRRIYVIKWENQFLPGINRIDDLDKKILEKEKNGIFNLILQNYKTLLLNNGFRYRQSIAQVRETIKRESDKLREFVESCLIKQVNSYIIKEDLYQKYIEWCKFHNYEAFAKQKFGANLPTYGLKADIRKIQNKTYRIWSGHNWNPENDWNKANIRGLGMNERLL